MGWGKDEGHQNHMSKNGNSGFPKKIRNVLFKEGKRDAEDGIIVYLSSKQFSEGIGTERS